MHLLSDVRRTKVNNNDLLRLCKNGTTSKRNLADLILVKRLLNLQTDEPAGIHRKLLKHCGSLTGLKRRHEFPCEFHWCLTIKRDLRFFILILVIDLESYGACIFMISLFLPQYLNLLLDPKGLGD